MGPNRRSMQFQFTILFILVNYFWEQPITSQAMELCSYNTDFGSSDEEVGTRLALRVFCFSYPEANECTNFYTYVCGRASNSQNLAPNVLDKESWKKVLDFRLEGLVRAKIAPEDEPAIRKIKQQHQLCTSADRRDQNDPFVLGYFLQRDSNFPMIRGREQWNSRRFKVLESQKYDPSLFSVRVQNDEIYIDQYDISAYGRFLSNLRRISAMSDSERYQSKIKEVFNHLRLISPTNRASFDEDLNKTMRFREELHRLAKLDKMEHTPMKVHELQSIVALNYPNWLEPDWLSFLQNVFKNVRGVNIDQNTVVHVSVEYMKGLRGLLVWYGPRCVANHIKLHFLETYMSETSRSLIRFSKELASAASPSMDLNSQRFYSDPCIYQPHMLPALNYMYLKKWLPQKTRDAASKMVEIIKNSWQNYGKPNGPEMRNNGQKWTLDEIRRVKVIVGSENKYSDYNLLDPMYQYEVGSNHLHSVLNARRAFKNYEYSKLKKDKDTILTDLAIIEDEPHVSTAERIINLPIGYMHRTSLSPSMTETMSYATFGYKISLFLNQVIINRGFPSWKFSKEGPWYGMHANTFSNKTACFENQYNSQIPKERSTTDDESKENPNDTLEQYVYENAAFQVAYNAFNNSEITQSRYSQEEFGIYWTNMHCLHDEGPEKDSISLRINNVLHNNNIFETIYHCGNRTTSRNQRDKCIFWE